MKNLPVNHLYDPSNAPEKELKKANIVLGKDYPKALVDLSETRKEALKNFKKITDQHKKNKKWVIIFKKIIIKNCVN